MLDKSMFVLNILSSKIKDFIIIIISSSSSSSSITMYHLENSLQSFNSS